MIARRLPPVQRMFGQAEALQLHECVRKARLKPGLRPWDASGGCPLAAAGEAADGAGDAALRVNDGPAAVRAADGARKGEPELGAV